MKLQNPRPTVGFASLSSVFPDAVNAEIKCTCNDLVKLGISAPRPVVSLASLSSAFLDAVNAEIKCTCNDLVKLDISG